MNNIITSPTGVEPIATVFGDTVQTKDIAAIMPTDTLAGSGFTLRARDGGKRFLCTNSGGISIIVPPFSASVPFAMPFASAFVQYGAGQITFVAGAGVTINSPETLLSAKQFASVLLIMDSTDVWTLAGYLEAA